MKEDLKWVGVRGCRELEVEIEADDWLRQGLKGKAAAVHHGASHRRRVGQVGEGNEAS